MMFRLINWEFTRGQRRQRTGSRHGETIRLDTQYSIMVRKLIKQNQDILPLENGHWLIGGKYQNVGGFKSVRTELDDVPTENEGWLYNDGTKWNDNDTTITVRGEGGRLTGEYLRKSIF